MLDYLPDLDGGLREVLQCISVCTAEISRVLSDQRPTTNDLSGSTNSFGDKQLKVDMKCDELIFARLRACSAVEAASSEEQPEIIDMPGKGYTVVFDPLDGSSIVGANFAVGTIFGVWPGHGVVGRTGRQQAAAAYAVYGPQTMLVWAVPNPKATASSPSHIVQQFVLAPDGSWMLVPSPAGLGQGPIIKPTSTVFAPANLRAAAHNKVYAALVDDWIAKAFTLRYTGGMVPDVHHIIAKRGGIFVNPASQSAPPKLRLVYECAPLALVIEAAGGMSHDGHGSMLDRTIQTTADRTIVCLGSSDLVAQSMPAMQASTSF
uniref:Fructose-bisphosphatase n=1 Tax=Chlamydomonas leiostraca TaxID=1034604 RepID=A0A7S0S0I6_9CHLO|mmetsp:Transcript_37063/g.93480  ORF Transcript_37063/g.93480 Transcript_37063/m.93480 type:complete len:319 (+) Transcript_37063:104-1060(+)|eukprot:CAMPEP_0202859242 /NCGR_PEP_ID=MMETSP1391-20130828/1446_1 /ASSEMBLY_ACC=CAM_ASM_000867 /TAXON_ID=1034604 /ORGANISM="Chlamydomonas leiostraca, Strain SAG 11-49" /LENGTH=318 /DNA_ID=CAMNT_0049538263 /DNA_START=102 /DNA_END=1058 /DNA_ORIENTATION=+